MNQGLVCYDSAQVRYKTTLSGETNYNTIIFIETVKTLLIKDDQNMVY